MKITILGNDIQCICKVHSYNPDCPHSTPRERRLVAERMRLLEQDEKSLTESESKALETLSGDYY